ncbi:sorting nexin-14-like isoform X1 [Acropora millepora]|uniref:sorting nexin-14-like isoform X1 n=1 Tax=Acropora millepora TaxID=45264 RepID=UPI001CF0F535|nr:sorting nexin-14-like isoform X1 [Acropora millepora]
MNTFERRDFESIRPVLVSGAVFVFIFTFQFYRCPPLLIGIWVLAFGVALGFVVFSFSPVLPSFLLHWGPRKKSFQGDHQTQTLQSGTCSICGNRKCQRHRPEISRSKLKPWEDLLIPESVDAALQEFLSLLLQNYVYSWYRELSFSETCVDELRTNLRYMAAVLLQRIRKIDIPTLVTDTLGKEGLKHLETYLTAKEKGSLSHSTSIHTTVLDEFSPKLHCALQNRAMELQYLRKLSESIIPFLLPPHSLHCRSLVSLFRELLARAVFLTATDKLSDPDFVNSLLLLFLDKEPMVASGAEASPKVPLLAKFAKSRAPITNSVLHLSVTDMLHSQSALFPFMQFMKSEGALNILQFCLTVEDFNKRVFVPELTKDEEKSLVQEAKEIFYSYFDTGAVDRINFDAEIVEGLKSCINNSGVESMERLKMATLLSRAFEYSYNLLERTFLPLFYQSDDYFSMLCGGRLPAKPLLKPASRVSKKKFDPLAEFSRLAGRLKDKVMNPNKDDSPFEDDPFDLPYTPPEYDLESEEEEEQTEEESRDFSMWNVTIPHVIMETKQKCIFIISVDRKDVTEASRWDVARRYNEFFVLQSKLKEFHGEIDDSLLPAKRNSSRSITQKSNSSYFESCRAQFEKYLQYLCSNPLLKGSALLFNFFSPDKEFSQMFGPEKVGDIAGKKIKSMTTILKKEKGQNIDSFLQAFLSSTVEPTKRKPLPKGLLEQSQRIEEGIYPLRRKSSSSTRLRAEASGKPLLEVTGATDYILFLAYRLFKVPFYLYSLLVCGKVAFQQTLDTYADRYLAHKVDLLTNEHRVATIIHLLRDAIFFDQDPPRTDTEKLERREKTLREMLAFLPDKVVRVMGADTHKAGITSLFELLQQRKLNKQLTYVLLDCIMGEIFPELKERDLFPADDLSSHS